MTTYMPVIGEIVSASEVSDLGPCEIVGLVILKPEDEPFLRVAGRQIFASRWPLPAMYVPLEPTLITRGDHIQTSPNARLHISKVVETY